MTTPELTKSIDSSEKFSNVDEFNFPTVNDLMGIDSPKNSGEEEIVKSGELFRSKLGLLRDAFGVKIPDDLSNKSVEIGYDTGNGMYNTLMLYSDGIVVFDNGCSYGIDYIDGSWRSICSKMNSEVKIVPGFDSPSYYGEVELPGFGKKTFSGKVSTSEKLPQISLSVERAKFDISVFNNCIDDIVSNADKCRIIVKDLDHPRFPDSMK